MAVRAPEQLPPLEVSDTDDPRVLEEAATDDYSLHVVPRTWRMDRVKLTMAWYGVATAFFYMYFAAFIALAYGTVNALIGIVLTVVAYTLVNTVIVRTATTQRAHRRAVLAQHVRLRRRGDRDADLRRDVHLLPRLRGLGHRGGRADLHRRPDRPLVRDRDRAHGPAGVEGRPHVAGPPQRHPAAVLPASRSSRSSCGRWPARATTASCPTPRPRPARRCRGCRRSRPTWASGS